MAEEGGFTGVRGRRARRGRQQAKRSGVSPSVLWNSKTRKNWHNKLMISEPTLTRRDQISSWLEKTKFLRIVEKGPIVRLRWKPVWHGPQCTRSYGKLSRSDHTSRNFFLTSATDEWNSLKTFRSDMINRQNCLTIFFFVNNPRSC